MVTGMDEEGEGGDLPVRQQATRIRIIGRSRS
jgi:hypothetical protein